MNHIATSHRVKTLLAALGLAGAVMLGGCASRAAQEVPVQRFESAMRSGVDKVAAGDLPQAATAFAKAEQLAVLYDRRELRLQALFVLGAVAALAEQDEMSRQAYAQALAEAQALGDAHSVGIARAGLADALRRAGDLDGALLQYTLALAPESLRADSVERLQARIGWALVRHAKGETSVALELLDALELQARASTSPVLPAVLVNQAVVLRDQGALQRAFDKVQEALLLDRRQANPALLAKDLELLGGIQQARQDGAAAKDSWERALRIAQATGQVKLGARMKQVLSAAR
jgi:tetratricopeptide (TPR) repeat protein